MRHQQANDACTHGACVHPNSQHEWRIGEVCHVAGKHSANEAKSDVGHLGRVVHPVSLGHSTCDDVTITDYFHLHKARHISPEAAALQKFGEKKNHPKEFHAPM